jgi:hypothetical protein
VFLVPLSHITPTCSVCLFTGRCRCAEDPPIPSQCHHPLPIACAMSLCYRVHHGPLMHRSTTCDFLEEAHQGRHIVKYSLSTKQASRLNTTAPSSRL